MKISVVIETWNLGDAFLEPLSQLLSALAPQIVAADAEVIVTCSSPPAHTPLEAALGRPITWLELPRDTGYYEHKNLGFDATTGDIVAFIDGDCAPSPTWLEALTGPIVGGASVVAGATSYPGPLAALANQIDFPYFDRTGARRRSIDDAPEAVRNFFANNVAFARAVFAARRYPTIEPMFHGQCQVLGLQLLAEDIAIQFAPAARVTHAWPESVREFLEVRLLRGADTVSLLPYVLTSYAPRASRAVTRLGAIPTLAIFGLRAIASSWAAVRRGPLVRGLGLVACVTVLDSLGAAAAPAVYRMIG